MDGETGCEDKMISDGDDLHITHGVDGDDLHITHGVDGDDEEETGCGDKMISDE